MQKIHPNHLVFADEYCTKFPIKIELVYADKIHPDNHFGQIYAPNARLLVHKELMAVTLLTAKRLSDANGWVLVLKDSLRPCEAQEAVTQTEIVKANPHWLVEPRFLSSAGQGGHPRGMAIDVGAIDDTGGEIDFGTRFDYFSSSTNVEVNKAHRNFEDLSNEIKENRKILEENFVQAAEDLGLEILPLPHEWWDFRFPKTYTDNFTPLSDEDLPDGYKMTVQNNSKATTAIEALEYIEQKLKKFI